MNSMEQKQIEQFKAKTLAQIVLEHSKDDEILKQISKVHKLRKAFILEKMKTDKKLFTHKKSKVMVEVQKTLRSIFDSKRFKSENSDLYEQYKTETTATTLKTTRVWFLNYLEISSPLITMGLV